MFRTLIVSLALCLIASRAVSLPIEGHESRENELLKRLLDVLAAKEDRRATECNANVADEFWWCFSYRCTYEVATGNSMTLIHVIYIDETIDIEITDKGFNTVGDVQPEGPKALALPYSAEFTIDNQIYNVTVSSVTPKGNSDAIGACVDFFAESNY